MNNKNTILDNNDYSNNIENNDNQLIDNNQQQNYLENYSDNQYSEFENNGYDLNGEYFDQYNIGYDLYNDYLQANYNQNDYNHDKYNNGALSTYYDNGSMHYNDDKNSFNAAYTENNFLTNNTIQDKLSQKQVSRRYFNLNPPRYKIRNLSTSFKQQKNKNPIINLFDLNFDIFPKDHIVLLSDNTKYITLFLNLMKNNIKRSSGFIYNNKTKNPSLNKDQKDIDILPSDLYQGKKINCEKKNIETNSFLNINYEKVTKLEKKSIKDTLSKILFHYKKKYGEKVLLDFFDAFKLTNVLDKKITSLSLFQKNRFFLLCDILVKKQVIYINNISNDLNLNEKIKFDRFLNNFFSDKNTILLITCNDLTEIKILANRAFVFSHDLLKNDDYFTNIMNYYESIDDYIILNTRK